MVTVLALLGVALVLFAAAVVATRDGGGLADAPQDLPDLDLPEGPLRADDVERVRFSMAPRGYRMSEVDAVLDRLAAELADRDRRLAQLGAPGVPEERPAADGVAVVPDERPAADGVAVVPDERPAVDAAQATSPPTGGQAEPVSAAGGTAEPVTTGGPAERVTTSGGPAERVTVAGGGLPSGGDRSA